VLGEHGTEVTSRAAEEHAARRLQRVEQLRITRRQLVVQPGAVDQSALAAGGSATGAETAA
jgi:hypothetical protein